MLTADRAIANVLLSVPLFGELSDDAIGDLASACTLLQVRAEEPVFSESEPANEVFFVVSGNVRLTCQTPEGPDVVVGYVEAGGVVGEMGVIDPAPRSASATAASESVILRLPGEALGAFIAEGHPVAAVLLAAIRHNMTQRIRVLNERIGALFLIDSEEVEGSGSTMTEWLWAIWSAMRTGG